MNTKLINIASVYTRFKFVLHTRNFILYTILVPVMSYVLDRRHLSCWSRTRFHATDQADLYGDDGGGRKHTPRIISFSLLSLYRDTAVPIPGKTVYAIVAVINVIGVRGCASLPLPRPTRPRRHRGAVINISLACQSLNPNNIICATPSSCTVCGRAACIRMAKHAYLGVLYTINNNIMSANCVYTACPAAVRLLADNSFSFGFHETFCMHEENWNQYENFIFMIFIATWSLSFFSLLKWDLLLITYNNIITKENIYIYIFP